MSEFKVGQKLYVVTSGLRGRGREEYQEITKIGRRWLTLDNRNCTRRIDKENLYVDGGQYSSPGRAYLSKEDYDHEVLLGKLWSRIYNSSSFGSRPKGVTVETMKKMLDEIEGAKNE